MPASPHGHLLTEMSDAPDLKGSSRLYILIFEEDGHACHPRQCPALQQGRDPVERLCPDTLRQGSLHSCGTQMTFDVGSVISSSQS